jgi:hypothetical protein
VPAKKTPDELEETLRERVYRWVYAESQPRCRIVVLFQNDVVNWANNLAKTTAVSA